MTKYHDNNYVKYLHAVTNQPQVNWKKEANKFGINDSNGDCPIFNGLFQFCQIYSGGSVAAANKLNHTNTNIAINWSGGLHHAHRSSASGFCYINDIVLAILELLKYHDRVLYIDIDIHHGDGVEEAF